MTAQRWVAGFRAPLVNPAEEIRLAEPRGFAGETLRQIARVAGAGSQLRVRLTNRYSERDLVIGAAHIAFAKTGSEIVGETDTVLRFAGAEQARIPAGADLISDPIELPIAAGTELALSLYLPEPTGFAAFAHLPAQPGWITSGDHTGEAVWSTAEETGSRFFLTGIDVLTDADAPVLVAFGDSWFEGVGSTPGGNHRSVDVLGEKLAKGWAVNQGIGGNRLLTDEVGEHGLARFERDVLSVPGVTGVWANFGINDLIVGGTAPAAQLIAGYIELARLAHTAGLPIYANTVGPFAGVIYPGLSVAEGVRVRREVNEWLRTTDVFDAVFDIAAAVQDSETGDFIRAEFDSGDGLHLNDAGHRAMAGAVDISALTAHLSGV
ncbi:GDSL-type esterase/lipase family protein [Nocardia sp. NBC_01503]|uniref:GDSL-type esterase/lipase family protein n=1 Tax=Nocardia sp. NBC_01503 TaxID=2975997 RepID=UPI002E7AB3CD|nr:GDSL-type esterase/lipase family protein [Nocardia sp. NBC_01503]WTL35426.1 GDSL-type esterase/lipase family protein [Nocardia sp. NBC_01503]